MKGNSFKKHTIYSGYSRAEIWSYGAKSKVRKRVKEMENRRYRRSIKIKLEDL